MFRLVFLSSVFLLQARGVALRQNRVWEGGGELYSLPVIIRFFWSACTFASTSRPDKTEVATRDVLCMYVCVCMCVCMYVCIYIYICRHVLIYITRPQAGRRAMRIIDIMESESSVSSNKRHQIVILTILNSRVSIDSSSRTNDTKTTTTFCLHLG